MYVDIVISNAFNLNKHFSFSFFLVVLTEHWSRILIHYFMCGPAFERFIPFYVSQLRFFLLMHALAALFGENDRSVQEQIAGRHFPVRFEYSSRVSSPVTC